MPCRTYETPEEIARFEQEAREHNLAPMREEIHVLKAELAERDAMLCGVFSLLEEGFESHGITFYLQAVLEKVDWQEAGVSMTQAKAWWADHKAQDEARKQAEAEAREQKRAAALSKLTQEEREILGV